MIVMNLKMSTSKSVRLIFLAILVLIDAIAIELAIPKTVPVRPKRMSKKRFFAMIFGNILGR